MSRILVTRSSMPDFEEYCKEIKKLWDSHWLTNMGAEHQELQRQLEERLGCPHVTLYTNGHLALENVIAAMGFPKGGEVITTPFTFASTTHAIVRSASAIDAAVGGQPVTKSVAPEQQRPMPRPSGDSCRQPWPMKVSRSVTPLT